MGTVMVNEFQIPLEFCKQMDRKIMSITGNKPEDVVDKVTVEKKLNDGSPMVTLEMLIPTKSFGLDMQGSFHTQMVAEKLMLNDFLERHGIDFKLNATFTTGRAGKEMKGFKKVEIGAWKT